MTKKQGIWLIVAVALFIVTGVVGVLMSAWSAKTVSETVTGTEIFTAAEDIMTAFPAEDFVAVVEVQGTIMESDPASGYISDGFDLEYTLDYIQRLMDCEQNAGILLFIDSGGGEMGASDEVYLKLMDYKERTGRPVYAYFDDYACSGAYYIAMAADEIWANRNSLCVNIGVYISTYNLSGLFEKYGIEQVMIRSSENKGIGSVGIPWTEEQTAIYQSIVDLYYDQFLDVVAAGRNMTKNEVKALDDGREMLAAQALDAGFIDGIGRYEEYTDRVLGYYDHEAVLYEEERATDMFTTIFEYFYGKLEALAPRSDGELLRDFVSEQDGIVVMAYAG